MQKTKKPEIEVIEKNGELEIILRGKQLKMFEEIKEHRGIEDNEEAMMEVINVLALVRVKIEIPRNYYDCIMNEFIKSKNKEKLKEWIVEAIKDEVSAEMTAEP